MSREDFSIDGDSIFGSPGGLSMDNIDSTEDASSLFGEPSGDEEDNNDNEEDNGVDGESSEDVDVSTVFGDEDQDGVDADEDEGAGQASEKSSASSPKQNFYSKALKALKEDGVLPDIEDDFIESADDAAKFADAIEKQVEARLSESERKLKQAAEAGADISEVSKYEKAVSFLSGIKEHTLEEDTDDAVDLRKRLIYQDYINRGFKKERAEREVAKSFDTGRDVEDAKSALEGNKEFYSELYDKAVAEAKAATLKKKQEADERVTKFKDLVLKSDAPMGIKVDQNIRAEVYNNATKATHKDSDGKLLTTTQKFWKDKPLEADYYFSLFYTLTDGFKSVDKIVGNKAKQQTKSALKSVESLLGTNSESLQTMFEKSKDKNEFFNNWKINI